MLEKLSQDGQKFIDLAKELSSQDKVVVAMHLAREVVEAARNAAPETVVKMAKELASSAPSAEADLKFEVIDGLQVVVGTLVVEGRQLETRFSGWHKGADRTAQANLAQRLGYRFATRSEHLGYVRSLLAKEEDNTINDAESSLLIAYRNELIMDSKGGLLITNGTIKPMGHRFTGFIDKCSYPALFVRAPEGSQ